MDPDCGPGMKRGLDIKRELKAADQNVDWIYSVDCRLGMKQNTTKLHLVHVLYPVCNPGPQSAVRSPQSALLFHSDRSVVHERSTGDFSFGVLERGNISQPSPRTQLSLSNQMLRRRRCGGGSFLVAENLNLAFRN